MGIQVGLHCSSVRCDRPRCGNSIEDIYYDGDEQGIEAKFNAEIENAKSIAVSSGWGVDSTGKVTCPRCQQWYRRKRAKPTAHTIKIQDAIEIQRVVRDIDFVRNPIP